MPPETNLIKEKQPIQVVSYTLMDDTAVMLHSGNIKEGIDRIILGMREIKNQYTANEWKKFTQSTFLNHSLTQLIHQCPFTYHSFIKPRGYAGDAELLDFIYRNKQLPSQTTSIGRSIYEYFITTPAPSSVRARCNILAETIDSIAADRNYPVHILSLACGHLREANKSIAIQEGNIGKFIAFDQDSRSLELIDRELDNDFIQTLQGSVTELIRQKQIFENLDLVYAAGLYDYLSQSFAIRLTKIMFDMLRSGGKLLVANFVPNHREIGYMETFMQWYLVYRTERQLEGVAQEIPISEIARKRTFFETNGSIVFLELVKT